MEMLILIIPTNFLEFFRKNRNLTLSTITKQFTLKYFKKQISLNSTLKSAQFVLITFCTKIITFWL